MLRTTVLLAIMIRSFEQINPERSDRTLIGSIVDQNEVACPNDAIECTPVLEHLGDGLAARARSCQRLVALSLTEARRLLNQFGLADVLPPARVCSDGLQADDRTSRTSMLATVKTVSHFAVANGAAP
jgi:hypothetical protein